MDTEIQTSIFCVTLLLISLYLWSAHLITLHAVSAQVTPKLYQSRLLASPDLPFGMYHRFLKMNNSEAKLPASSPDPPKSLQSQLKATPILPDMQIKPWSNP